MLQVIVFQRFETTYWAHLQESRCSRRILNFVCVRFVGLLDVPLTGPLSARDKKLRCTQVYATKGLELTITMTESVDALRSMTTSRLCNPCGFWPAQLSLSILSRNVFTECRCQRHVKPPNLEDQWLERSNSRHKESPASETKQANPSSGRWNYGRENTENFVESGDLHVNFGFFSCRKFTTWDRRLYFPSEGRRAFFFLPKNPTASARFEPANSGTKGQHAHL